jgi:hypothetical protein
MVKANGGWAVVSIGRPPYRISIGQYFVFRMLQTKKRNLVMRYTALTICDVRTTIYGSVIFVYKILDNFFP